MLFEHNFYLTKPIWAPICLHDFTRESFTALTDIFDDAFVRENVARIYDVVTTYDARKFDADAILLKELQCKKRDIF